MACDTQTLPTQTLAQRKQEVRETLLRLQADIASGRVKPLVGPQGAIAFQGWTNRNRVTDACAFRMIMATGSASAKMAIARAEQLAGRSVSKQAVNAGVHLHGSTWHHGH